MLDTILVGFGLGGATLAFRLEEQGKTFHVFDNGRFNSSKVAGGMMNPVILKRFSLAWDADAQMEIATALYTKLEKRLGLDFLQKVELYRKFASVEEQNNWFSAADNPRLATFLDTKLVQTLCDGIPAEFSFGKVVGTKRVDTVKMLESYAQILGAEGKLKTEDFSHAELKIEKDHIQYRGLKARRIIFCEGFGMLENPYFNYLPTLGNKGEYLIIHSPSLKLQVVIKSSVFISPAGNDNYVVGATYNHSDKSVGATERAREELEAKLRKMINVPYEVVNQISGIRPSTVDRKPLVGRHPEQELLFCCNGFGSRGVLAAPSVSKNLLEFIQEGKAMPEEIDIARFTRKWYSKKE